MDDIQQGKTAAITTYFTIVGTLIALSMNADPKTRFASFHIRQSLGLHLGFYIVGVFISHFFDSWFISLPFYLFFGVLWFYGFWEALQGRKTVIPLVGLLFQKWFGFIK